VAHLTPFWHQLVHRDHVWMHHRYPLVGLRYLEAFAELGKTHDQPNANVFWLR
jgi:hypothetical protein